MSRKDYQAFADMIRSQLERATCDDARKMLREIAGDMTRVFACDNPRFSTDRFLTACGFGD